jgi:hypothetical protein
VRMRIDQLESVELVEEPLAEFEGHRGRGQGTGDRRAGGVSLTVDLPCKGVWQS